MRGGGRLPDIGVSAQRAMVDTALGLVKTGCLLPRLTARGLGAQARFYVTFKGV